MVRPHWGADVFRIPWPVLSPAAKVMSLKRPTAKMSKSDADPKSRILITDTADEIHAKVRGAVTDSEPGGITFDPERRPGVSNLIEILRHVSESNATSYMLAKDVEHLTMKAFKELVAAEIVRALAGVRERFLEIMEPTNTLLHEQAHLGGTKARRQAIKTLKDVKKSIGLQTLMIPWHDEEEAREERGAATGAQSLDDSADSASAAESTDQPPNIQWVKSKRETTEAIKEAMDSFKDRPRPDGHSASSSSTKG